MGRIIQCGCRIGRFVRANAGGWVHLKTVVADAKAVQPWQAVLAAHLQDLHLAHHRVAMHALAQPDQTVRDGKHRVGIFLVEVFANQKGRGLPTRQHHAQLLHELLKAVVPLALTFAGEHHRAKGIDEHQRRSVLRDFVRDALQRPVELASQSILGQVDETNRSIDGFSAEERKLLLVAQHLQRRLAQHGEVDCGPLWRGQRKHDLVRQRGLAATRQAGDEIE